MRNKDDEKTDAELLRHYLDTSDLEWLSTLFLRYSSMVYGVCLKYLRDREEAKDAVMQVHEKLIENLHKHAVENFKSWLYVTARNHCLMYLRAQKGKKMEEIQPFIMESGPNGHPEEEPGLEQNLARLEKCIESLESDQKACVRLFYLQEKCYKDIALETGFDLKAVKSYIQNGKRNLKICLEKE